MTDDGKTGGGVPSSGPSALRPPGAVRAPDVPPGLPWFNTPRPLRLAELRGRFVLLDFWTSGCINCLHVLPDLHRLEAAHADALVVIGVHAPKFAEERTEASVAAAVRRYGVGHPVVSDADLALWSAYAVRAWPTLVLIDPDGYVVAQRSGEGAFAPFDRVLTEQIPRYRAAGRLHPAPLPAADDDDDPPPVAGAVALRYPAGLAADAAGGRLFIADTGHHRLLVADVAGRVLQTIGAGAPGLVDGPAETARFRDPRGLAYDAETDALFVADTGNHAVRRVDLATGAVATLTGTGRQAPWGAATTGETEGALSSPWDVLLHDGWVWVAMAGVHQIWRLDPATGQGAAWAGNAYEHLVDAPRRDAQLAQPSALATDGAHLFFLDAESSALRRVPFGGDDAAVETLIGEGLFAFGDVDGRRPQARLQHPLGLLWTPDGLVLADTYNHRLKRYDAAARAVFTLAGDGRRGRADGGPNAARFDEPGALAWDGARVVVADTNNHRLAAVDLGTGVVTPLSVSAPSTPERTALAPRRVAPGEVTLTVQIALPAGSVPNAEHPGTLRLALPDGVREAPAAPSVRFTFPLSADAEAVLGGAVYHCAESDGTCRVAPVGLRLPLRVRAGAEREAHVRIDVPPAEG